MNIPTQRPTNKIATARTIIVKICAATHHQLNAPGTKTVTNFHRRMLVETLYHRAHEVYRGKELPIDWRT